MNREEFTHLVLDRLLGHPGHLGRLLALEMAFHLQVLVARLEF